MKVLVTGREGQLARSLIETAHRDIELIAIGHREVDLAASGSVARAIAAVAPDVVVNAAAYTAVDQAEDEPELAFRINAEAAEEASAAAREVGARIIQISTDYVFDGEGEGAYREETATNPLNVYGRSKLAGEERVRLANPQHLILRTAWLYSPFGRNFVKSIMAAARERDVLTVVDDQVGSPTSALDLAGGIVAVLGHWREGIGTGLGETYHLAGFGSTSWYGLAEHILAELRELGLPTPEVRPIHTEDWPTKAARPRNSVLDSGKFVRDFGYSMPDWRQSVSNVVRRLAQDES